jgi:OOP family OmpA-OmpF porin
MMQPHLSLLVNKGLVARRLASENYGETKPVATNQTDEGRALNLRIEFTIISN